MRAPSTRRQPVLPPMIGQQGRVNVPQQQREGSQRSGEEEFDCLVLKLGMGLALSLLPMYAGLGDNGMLVARWKTTHWHSNKLVGIQIAAKGI